MPVEEIKVKKFKLSDNDIWVGYVHLKLLNGEIIFCAGGIPTEEHYEKAIKYFKTKRMI